MTGIDSYKKELEKKREKEQDQKTGPRLYREDSKDRTDDQEPSLNRVSGDYLNPMSHKPLLTGVRNSIIEEIRNLPPGYLKPPQLYEPEVPETPKKTRQAIKEELKEFFTEVREDESDASKKMVGGFVYGRN